MPSSCHKKIKVWNDGELMCSLPAGHDDVHESSNGTDYQMITWFPGDRREYEGEFKSCDYRGCSLPIGHRGAHAI